MVLAYNELDNPIVLQLGPVSHLVVLVNAGHGAEVVAVRVAGVVWEVLLALVGVVVGVIGLVGGVVGLVVGVVVGVWRPGVLHALLELLPL